MSSLSKIKATDDTLRLLLLESIIKSEEPFIIWNPDKHGHFFQQSIKGQSFSMHFIIHAFLQTEQTFVGNSLQHGYKVGQHT